MNAPALPPRLRRYAVTVDPASGCVRLTGAPHDKDGYARVGGTGAHRIAWAAESGPVPPGRVLDHVRARGCQWRDCILTAHLEPVTPRVNTLRGTSFAALNAVKDRCGTCGTPYDLFNTYVTPDGRRNCRTCNRAAVARYRARLRRAAAPSRATTLKAA